MHGCSSAESSVWTHQHAICIQCAHNLYILPWFVFERLQSWICEWCCCMYFDVYLVAPMWGDCVECAAQVCHSAECPIIGIECPAMIMSNPQGINLRCCNRVWCVSALSAAWLQFHKLSWQMSSGPLVRSMWQHYACLQAWLCISAQQDVLHSPRSNQPKRLNVCIKFLLTCRVCPQHLKGAAHGTLHWV